MRTSCTHCGTHFNVPDKTLGKSAKCKSCGKMFVITPVGGESRVDMEEVPKMQRRASDRPKKLAAPPPPEPESDDPLDALADAAYESSSHMRPTHPAGHGPASSSRYADGGYDEDGGYGRKRMAKGANLSMGMGIAGLLFALGGGLLSLLAMFLGAAQTVMIVLGSLGIALLAIAAVMGMMAVAHGTSAGRKIRRARHPLGGRGQASTGTGLGWVTLGLVLITAIGGGIWLINRGGIQFEQTVDAQGNPVDAQPENTPPTGDSPTNQSPDAAQPPAEGASGQSSTATSTTVSKEDAKAAVGIAAGIVVVFLIVSLVLFAFWLWMLIDCCTKTFPKPSDKTMWVLIIIFLGALGALIYLFAGRPKKAPARRRAAHAR